MNKNLTEIAAVILGPTMGQRVVAMALKVSPPLEIQHPGALTQQEMMDQAMAWYYRNHPSKS